MLSYHWCSINKTNIVGILPTGLKCWEMRRAWSLSEINSQCSLGDRNMLTPAEMSLDYKNSIRNPEDKKMRKRTKEDARKMGY